MTDSDRQHEERQKAHEELVTLYQVTTQDLVFFKQQQWSITNYGLLLYAAIIGISEILKANVSSCERLILCFLASGLAVAGVYLLWRLETSVKARRDRLGKIRRLFTKTFCLAWESKHKAADSPMISVLLGTILIVRAGIVWWLVYIKVPTA